MPKDRSNRIAEQRQRKGWSQNQLADAIGVHWTTVSKLERGITRLDTQYVEDIAKALGVDELDILPKYERWVKIALSGYLHHGGTVDPVEEGEEQAFGINTTSFFDPERFWLRVVGDALYPYFRHDDLLALEWLTEEDRHDENGKIDYSGIVGRFGLVEDQNGNQFVGIISLGSKPETVELHNANYPPLRNIEPYSIAQVVFAMMATPSRAKERKYADV